ncbi:hemerythrin domain-containing protein [Mycobacterium sp. 050134]|uniref:hemerythrin domain-containing protein n=1 Tax=Mycobacterium sp. 050134 TaxID=3096111 RepID=UPI002ED829F7
MSERENQMFDPREMVMVHTMLRREFGLLPDLLRATTASDAERRAAISAHFDLIANILHHHHQAEDDHLWPQLLKRSVAASSIVDVLETQHCELAALLESSRVCVRRWVSESDLEHAAAAFDSVDQLNAALDEHLRVEEQQVVPLMQMHITAAEWDAMVQLGAADADPQDLLLGLGMLAYEADPDVLATAIAAIPADAQPAVRQLAADSFAQYSLQLYETVTPRRSTDLRRGQPG